MFQTLLRQMAIASVAFTYASDLPMARAQGASEWDNDMHSAARVIVGAPLKSADALLLRAGIQIRLDSGWDTYWRYPGDSGVPPTFDFGGSENVKTVTVLWPAPERFPDGAGGHSIAYVGELLLPLRIIPSDPAKPSTLGLKLDYAVCATMCIPAKSNLTLPLSGGIGVNEKALQAAEARVPRREPLGSGDSLVIRAVHREAHQRVGVEVTAPEGASVDLFVEGPTPEWSLPLPEQSWAAGTIRRFTFDLDGLPPGANANGVPLTFTVVSPNDAIEVVTPLD